MKIEMTCKCFEFCAMNSRVSAFSASFNPYYHKECGSIAKYLDFSYLNR